MEIKSPPQNKPRAQVKLKKELKVPLALSLFSSGGIGDLGVEAAGMQIILANELIPSRVALYQENFSHPVLPGDIRERRDEIIETSLRHLAGKELFLFYATPPCQGMSSNGLGKLKSEVALGRRAEEDARNRLVIPAMDIAIALRPRWILFENVPGMEKTDIRTDENHYENIIAYIQRRLGNGYAGCAEVIACEDFGIPQKRRRLITLYTRDESGKRFFKQNGGTFFAQGMKEAKRTLRDAIGNLPALDARLGKNSAKEFHPYHYVPVMSDLKYQWVVNTAEGSTAFNNQCVNPACLSQDNPGHQDIKLDGKWVSSKSIPILCGACGSLLPRPHVVQDGVPRLLKGFHSAYRRMKWDEPARTITQNFLYEASDNKIHPEQNRVLSILEATVLQTIDRYPYKFEVNGKTLSSARIAEVIGESVPPYLIEKICRMMREVSSDF